MRKVLLDESLPRQLRNVLAGLDVTTVPEAGWASKKNGELLQLAQGSFDVLLTGDRNIQFQQNLVGLRIGVVVAAARSTKLEDLLPMLPRIRDAIERVQPADLIEVEAE